MPFSFSHRLSQTCVHRLFAIFQDLFWRLKERLKTEEKFDHLYSAFLAIPLKERKTVLVFMKHLASLCWKMATQQEQMSFDVDTGEHFDLFDPLFHSKIMDIRQ